MRSFVEKRRTAFFVEKSSIFLKKSLDISSASRYNNTRRQGHGSRRKEYADVAELADALDSGSSSLKRVWVQIPSSAPKSSNVCSGIFCFSDLFGMTGIAPSGAVGVPPCISIKCPPCKYTYPACKNVFCKIFPASYRAKVSVFAGTTAVLLLQSAQDAL